MDELNKDILSQNTDISKLIASLPVGHSIIADDGVIASMLQKRQIPFEIRQGFIILAPAAARWFQRQFG